MKIILILLFFIMPIISDANDICKELDILYRDLRNECIKQYSFFYESIDQVVTDCESFIHNMPRIQSMNARSRECLK